ncbi:MAG: hypothetical protein H7Y27_05745 [Gemmatimonadaceae bacterium]|nr:hypothetical protein [Chitinophagaceae bacterium]
MNAAAQDVETILNKVRAKLETVNDYEAVGEMKTNISFLKTANATVTVFFKRPNKLKIKNEQGISLVPKGSVSLSLNNLVSGKYQIIDGGKEKINGKEVAVIKLLPTDETTDVVLSTLYIDVESMLVVRARTTTRDNGTNELEMSYGRYAANALPDRVVFSFNTQEYKLPKGVTFDYDDGSAKKKTAETAKDKKGKIEIVYRTYKINKGIADAVFK